MNTIFAASLLPFAYGLLVDATWKALLLLLLATVAALAANRSSASVRHRIWCLSFSALILLPVLCAAGPRWKVALLPGGEASPAVDVRGSGPASKLPAVEIAETDRASDPAPDASQLDPATTAAQSHAGRSAHIPQPGETRGPSGMIIQLSFVMLWMVVALALLARLALESAVVRRLVAGCRPLSDDRWNGLVSELQARLRVRRPVRLLECDETIVPVTCRLVRPVILLPAASRDWSLARRRCVLLHELAHVKRYDVFFQMLARTACSLYWFNPLVWYGLGRLRIERELACDDAVVAAGESPVDYADQLVEIARMCRRSRSVVGIAMARSSNLEERVAALLDRARSHRLLSPPTDGLLAGAVLALLIAAAALQPAARAAADSADGQPTADSTPRPAATTITAEREASMAVRPLTLRGRVTDPENKPISGARIWAWRLASTDWDWKPVATADSNGLFRFEVDAATLVKTLKRNAEQSLRQKVPVRLAATVAGFGFGVADVPDIGLEHKEPLSVGIRVVQDLPLSGRILTADGQPAAGVRVYLADIRQPSQTRLDQYIRKVANGGARSPLVMDFKSVGGIPGQPHNFFGEGEPNAVADRAGRITINGIGAGRIVSLMLHGPSIPNSWIAVVMRPVAENGQGRSETGAIRLQSEDGDMSHYFASFTHVSAPTRILQGLVRDHQTRQPVSGVLVQLQSAFPDRPSAVTGADGRFRLVGFPKAKNYVVKANVKPERYVSIYVDVADTAGIGPLEFPIDMWPGIAVKGRVTDARTGKPVSARVRYLPLAGNRFLDRLGDHAGPQTLSPGIEVAGDGSYQLQALPGPGVIAVESSDDSYTIPKIDLKRMNEILQGSVNRRVMFNREDFLYVAINRRQVISYSGWQFKGLALINPSEGSSGLTQNLVLVPGQAISGAVLGEDGQPLRGVKVAGLNFGHDYPRYETLADEKFTVQGVAADEQRLLLFSHSEKGLGAFVELPVGKIDPLAVRLERCGSLVGRVVDVKGQPVAGQSVDLAAGPERSLQVLAPLNKMLKTDQEGKFRFDGLIPGLTYQASIRSGPRLSVKLKPAETHDTGTIRLEQSLGARKT